jgi:hypothetical protein
MGASGKTPFKMFGLQRTGTNLMVALMQRNFHVHSLEIGAEWKHGPLQSPDRQWHGAPARFVLCVRNPYAWLVSCYRLFRRTHNADCAVAPQFQRDPSMSFEEFVVSPSYEFETPVHRWNHMNGLWLDTLPAGRHTLVRQEDQLEGQVGVLERVERELGLTRLSAELRLIEAKIDVNAAPAGPMDRDYCLDREYMSAFGPALLDRVNAALDWDLMARLGYPAEQWTLAEREIGGLRLTVRPCTSDAAEARESTSDPYHFREIAAAGLPVRHMVDIGARIGAASALARTIWPQCRILAYESCPENYRLLRINARRLGNVTAIHAVSLAPALDEPGEIDLLKIGCPRSLIPILEHAEAAGMLPKIASVCGRLGEGQGDYDKLSRLLARTRSLKKWNAGGAAFFWATMIR